MIKAAKLESLLALIPIDSSLFKRFVEDFPGRTNKRTALDIFLIPRLFSYKGWFVRN